MLQNRDGYQLLHFVPKCALYLIKSEERQHIHSNLTTESSGTSSDPLPLQKCPGYQFISVHPSTKKGGLKMTITRIISRKCEFPC